jgi:membrane protein DedA with SNARE-associated domain
MIFLALQIAPLVAKTAELLHDLANKLGGPGVMLIAFGDSSFLSLPEGNDLLIVVLSIGSTWKHMAYYVAMTIIGSIIGCYLLYMAGRKGGNPILRRRFSQKSIENAEMKFKKYGILSVIVPSILPPPCPFKIFVLIAGVFRLNTTKFITAVTIGRTIRYSIWGVLGVLYGGAVKNYMQENLQTAGVILSAVFLLTMGIALYFYFLSPRPGNP